MKMVRSEVRYLAHGSQKYPIVTDNEKAFLALSMIIFHNAPDSFLGTMSLILQSYGLDDMVQLPLKYQFMLATVSSKVYGRLCTSSDELKKEWSQAFVFYYMEDINEKVQLVNSFIDNFSFYVIGNQSHG